jgi:hypothetical protein
VLINDYLHTATVPLIGGTFNTVIGAVFLLIVLLSPGGLLGIWSWLQQQVRGAGSGPAVATAGADAPNPPAIDKPGG